jgi:hypothetical protein
MRSPLACQGEKNQNETERWSSDKAHEVPFYSFDLLISANPVSGPRDPNMLTSSCTGRSASASAGSHQLRGVFVGALFERHSCLSVNCGSTRDAWMAGPRAARVATARRLASGNARLQKSDGFT